MKLLNLFKRCSNLHFFRFLKTENKINLEVKNTCFVQLGIKRKVKPFIFITILIFMCNGFSTANEIKDGNEKKELTKKINEAWESQLESQKMNNTASLVYSVSIYQNNIYMASRNLVENFFNNEKNKMKINDLAYFYNIKKINKEVLKNVAAFSNNSMCEILNSYKKEELSKAFFNDAKFEMFNKTIYIKLSIEKNKILPNGGEKFYIADRKSLELLALITKIHFKDGDYIDLTYSRNLSADELSDIKNKNDFNSGLNNAKNSEEMIEFIKELDNETPRLFEDCPWLKEKKYSLEF